MDKHQRWMKMALDDVKEVFIFIWMFERFHCCCDYLLLFCFLVFAVWGDECDYYIFSLININYDDVCRSQLIGTYSFVLSKYPIRQYPSISIAEPILSVEIDWIDLSTKSWRKWLIKFYLHVCIELVHFSWWINLVVLFQNWNYFYLFTNARLRTHTNCLNSNNVYHILPYRLTLDKISAEKRRKKLFLLSSTEFFPFSAFHSSHSSHSSLTNFQTTPFGIRVFFASSSSSTFASQLTTWRNNGKLFVK